MSDVPPSPQPTITLTSWSACSSNSPDGEPNRRRAGRGGTRCGEGTAVAAAHDHDVVAVTQAVERQRQHRLAARHVRHSPSSSPLPVVRSYARASGPAPPQAGPLPGVHSRCPARSRHDLPPMRRRWDGYLACSVVDIMRHAAQRWRNAPQAPGTRGSAKPVTWECSGFGWQTPEVRRRRHVRVEITLVGDVTIRRDDQPAGLPLGGANPPVAAALLTLERAQGVSRERLADALWPGGLPATWDSALRTAISRVRSWVTAALPPGAANPVEARGGRYRLLFPAGAEAAALAAADEAVQRAPLRESAHRCRMAAHAAGGNRAEALRAYQRLRRVLADELGVDPAAETEAAYLELLGPAPPTRRAAGPRDRAPAAPPPFVGRESELAVLAAAWDRAAAGARHVVVVTGEAGIGKTRLTTEAARRMSADGGVVLFGRCDQEAIVPYQPVVEALDGYVAATPPDELPTLDDAARAELASVLPSIGGPRRVGEPGGRAALFDAVTALVASAARERPVLP